MNPLSIRLRNVGPFEDLELDLPAGCLAVVGPNGAGKSTIVNAIDIALFGPSGRTLADHLTDDAASTELEITLTFEHAADFYRVRRGFSAKGRGKSTLDFERRDGFEEDWALGTATPEWTPLTRESAKETQAAIEETLGLSRRTFRASAFLRQGDGGAFCEAPPSEAKKILIDVIGVGVWDRLLEAARTDHRIAERELNEVSGRTALLEEQGGDVTELERERKAAEAEAIAYEVSQRAAESELMKAAEKVAELERAESSYKLSLGAVESAMARLAERQATVDRAAAATDEAVAIQAEVDRIGDPSARLEELERRRAELDSLRALRREREVERDKFLAEATDSEREGVRLVEERSRVEQTLAELTAKEEALSDPENQPTCDRCGQAVHGEAFDRALLQISAERDDAAQRVKSYTARVDELVVGVASRRRFAAEIEIPEAPDADAYAALIDEIQETRKTELVIGAARERLSLLERTVAEVTPELTAEVARLAAELLSAKDAFESFGEPEPGALDAAKQEALAAKARVDEVAARLTESRAALIRAESALEQARKFAEELSTARARRDGLLGEIDLLSLLERAYGRDGIPALIVEASAIPSIETEANRILAELGTSYRVELRTQRALKSGDGLADTLDVVVFGEGGEPRAYETYSGGERSCLNVSLRIGLALLLTTRRGAESKVLVLDEIEYLDEGRQAALANVLLGLQDRFEKIVCVSHATTLRDVFDNCIVVEKEDGRSRIAA